jgi:DNA repair protein RadD
MTITLRPNQIAAADAVEDGWRAGILRPLVDSCVGSGKSLTIAELALRAFARAERSLVLAHTRELVEQNAGACRAMGLQTGINAAALKERCWRAPVISAAIQSIYKHAHSFGPIGDIFIDESHLLPHSETGMYRELLRAFPNARVAGFSGTVFRLQGGSLVEGEGAPFDKVVYRYSIIDGIRDGYLVPAFSAPADDKIDVTKLKTKQGEFTGESQDAQMIALMDNHIAQMLHHGRDRRAWLVFEASTKAAKAMVARLNEWGIPTGLVLGETAAPERSQTIAAYRAGRLRALVNVAALTTGFDVQEVDMLVMRRKTKSLGLYIQMTGRLLRTIGGNIAASIGAGKPDGIVLDFAGNIDEHGPLDFIRPKDTVARLISCENCNKRVAAAAVKCWSCDEPMTKLCPACLCSVQKGVMDCPECNYDMRVQGAAEPRKAQALLDTPSGAALISSFKPRSALDGGWVPVRRAWDTGLLDDVEGVRWVLPAALLAHAADARWVRGMDGAVEAILVPNGSARGSVRQYAARDGSMLVVPMPSQIPVDSPH